MLCIYTVTPLQESIALPAASRNGKVHCQACNPAAKLIYTRCQLFCAPLETVLKRERSCFDQCFFFFFCAITRGAEACPRAACTHSYTHSGVTRSDVAIVTNLAKEAGSEKIFHKPTGHLLSSSSPAATTGHVCERIG